MDFTPEQTANPLDPSLIRGRCPLPARNDFSPGPVTGSKSPSPVCHRPQYRSHPDDVALVRADLSLRQEQGYEQNEILRALMVIAERLDEAHENRRRL
ncbi:hypothetical protein J2Z21_003362 [Streptomyces griseochromogenes]|uniref:DivIVA domain-containing protein n=1 Tax=Streptomyces griseochromogenes TaxID=68214 RepID=A0ABS4LSP2_9ACTN|nr:hypothetical protein [Streptomyces griseochromogenes]MBP2050423.1 hypothetical protein [Streptomyces griseochromogenes]